MTNHIPSVRNITRVFRTADAYQIATAGQWYSDAYAIADALAVKHGLRVDTVVAVIAVLSPMNAWGNNINLSARVIEGKGTLTTGGLPANIAKANRLILGESPDAVIGGQKVKNFYLSILTRGEFGLTVDRHAYDIAVNTRHTDATRPGISKGLYATITAMYERAATILSKEYGQTFTAGQTQAVTWTTWRGRYWAVGAWDNHDVSV